MNDMTSVVLCDKGVVGGYRRGVVVGKSCVSEIGSRCGRVSESLQVASAFATSAIRTTPPQYMDSHWGICMRIMYSFPVGGL